MCEKPSLSFFNWLDIDHQAGRRVPSPSHGTHHGHAMIMLHPRDGLIDAQDKKKEAGIELLYVRTTYAAI